MSIIVQQSLQSIFLYVMFYMQPNARNGTFNGVANSFIGKGFDDNVTVYLQVTLIFPSIKFFKFENFQ